jgi:hypothetical protein
MSEYRVYVIGLDGHFIKAIPPRMLLASQGFVIPALGWLGTEIKPKRTSGHF